MKHTDLGIRVSPDDLGDNFIVGEGEGNIIIGKIRNGKSWLATMMIWIDLLAGKTVYATWPVVTDHIDDREEWFYILRSLLLPWKKRFFVIPTTENFHYINAETGEVDGVPTFGKKVYDEETDTYKWRATTKAYIRYLNSLNHCSLYIDEFWRIGNHVLIAKDDMEDMFNLILVTGHKFRTVTVIAQRLVGINPTFRDNANRVYRVSKASFFGFVRFLVEEYQDGWSDTIPDSLVPDAVHRYWLDMKIARSYNSWYYGEMQSLHELVYSAYDLSYRERLIALFLRCKSVFALVRNPKDS